MKTVFASIALLLATSSAFAQKVIGVTDGDTLTLLVDNRPLKVRLANVDAPEKAQAFGERSKKSLFDMCFGKDATYQEQDVDQRGNTVAIVTCAGVEANRVQVERGMAWVNKKSNKDLLLFAVEAKASMNRQGLWSDPEPIPPWEFRRPVRKAKAAAPKQRESIEGICFIGKRGEEYRIVSGARQAGC